MTFSELVLKSRRRLFDIREKTGQIIDDASKDGIRWSSLIVQELCKSAITELLRTLTSLKLHEIIDEGVGYRIVFPLTIQAGSGDLTGDALYNTKFSKVLKLQTPDLKRIYSFENQEKFFSNRYLTSTLLDLSRPVDDAVFTSLYDGESKKVIIKTLPMYVSVIENVQAIVRVSYDEILTLGATEQVPIVDSEDLLLDYIEREARRIEHNPNQLVLLNDTIKNKLAEMKLGLSGNPQ